MLLDCIAMEFFLLILNISSSILKRGPGSWWALQGTSWKVDKNNSPGLRTQVTVRPTLRGGWVGGVIWGTLSMAGRLSEKLLINEMLDFICCISSFGHASAPATSVTDRKQMFNFAEKRHSEIWNWELRRPFSFVPPQKQIEEGKLHPNNDPARGLNYNRLKPVPCFKDLCNLKRKKSNML